MTPIGPRLLKNIGMHRRGISYRAYSWISFHILNLCAPNIEPSGGGDGGRGVVGRRGWGLEGWRVGVLFCGPAFFPPFVLSVFNVNNKILLAHAYMGEIRSVWGNTAADNDTKVEYVEIGRFFFTIWG